MSGSFLNSIANPTVVKINPLENYGAALGVKNQINRNDLFEAQRAAGQVFQNSLNPDGTQNQAALNQGLKTAGPGVALAAQDTSQAGLTNSTGEFDLHMKKLTGVNAAAMALTAQYPNGVPKAAVDAEIDRVGAAYGLSSQQIAQTKSSFGPDPVANSRTIIRNGISNLSAQEALHASRPGAVQISNGSGTVGANVAPAAADNAGALSGPMGQGVANNLSPETKVQTQGAIGPDGTPGTVPIGSKYDAQGNLLPIGWGNPSKGGGSYGGQQQAPAAPAGFTPTSMAPGQQQAADAAATGAAQSGQAAFKAAEAAVSNKAQLNNMEADLNQMQATGPGSDKLALANAITQKYGGFGITMSAQELASSEGFAKIGKQIAQAQAASLGGSTDDARAMAMGANPNRDLSKLGNKEIIAMLKGNNDAIVAHGKAYQQWLDQGNSPASYNKFQTEFNKSFDPRVYQWGHIIKDMTPAQRQSSYDAMPDKTKFRASYNDAVKSGLLNPNGQ